jgi:AmiR/NasT family two-component response regulator
MVVTTFDLGNRPEHTHVGECQAEIQDLRAALDSRPIIDQAKGILMARHGCSAEAAFQMLRLASMRDNRRVRDLAAAIVDSVQAAPADGASATRASFAAQR